MGNPNTIPWLHYQDIQTEDAALRNDFNHYMRSGLYIEAINLLKTNEQQLLGKAYISDSINKIINGIAELQILFNQDVNVYLSDLATRYFNLISNIIKRGEWNNTVAYEPYNFVVFNDEIYMAINVVPVGAPITDGNYWLKLGLKGQQGDAGVDVKVRYYWESGKQYSVNDLVVYQGDIYVALKDNKGVVPTNDKQNWMLFIVISRGKINVGTSAPDNPLQNSIWFKTSRNPLAATKPVSGEFFRYAENRTWERMNPATFFSWVQGTDKYNNKLAVRELNLKRNNWTYLKGNYIYTVNDELISQNTRVELINRSVEKDKIKFYSSLNIEVNPNQVILKSKESPTDELLLTLTMQ